MEILVSEARHDSFQELEDPRLGAKRDQLCPAVDGRTVDISYLHLTGIWQFSFWGRPSRIGALFEEIDDVALRQAREGRAAQRILHNSQHPFPSMEYRLAGNRLRQESRRRTNRTGTRRTNPA